MIIRTGKREHLAGCVRLAEEFLAESDWSWKFNRANSTETFDSHMDSPESTVLVVEQHRRVVGFALLAFDSDFHDERIGYVSKFYIGKEARGTEAGRKLVRAAVDWFDFHDCVDSFATDTGNISRQGKAFSSLFQKFGYNQRGGALVRRNPGYEQS